MKYVWLINVICFIGCFQSLSWCNSCTYTRTNINTHKCHASWPILSGERCIQYVRTRQRKRMHICANMYIFNIFVIYTWMCYTNDRQTFQKIIRWRWSNCYHLWRNVGGYIFVDLNCPTCINKAKLSWNMWRARLSAPLIFVGISADLGLKFPWKHTDAWMIVNILITMKL